MPSNHKRLIVLKKAFNIIIKWDELGHVWIHNLRLKEILPITDAILSLKPLIICLFSALFLVPLLVENIFSVDNNLLPCLLEFLLTEFGQIVLGHPIIAVLQERIIGKG